MSFTYDDNGIRTSKTVDGVTHTYQLNGSQIVSEQWEDKLIVYLYDAAGSPIGMMYRTTSYAEDAFDVFWFEKNLEGDVVAIYSSYGIKVATYTYNDAWGNHTVSYSNGGVSSGAYYNPFRYRGYYYDTDLGMYYLQSRYYDPNTCRFINADGVMANVGGNILGNNLYVYCFNNPVNLIDGSGSWPKWVTDTINWIEKNIVNPVSNFISGISHDIENFDINNTKESNVFSSYYDINSFDVFWFEKNLQGDIVAVYNSAGTKVAYYTYTDAWGNHSVGYINLSTNEGVQYNPFRYRGYYYDTDLGMYYLQSRYYDPNTCRFINADGYVSTGQGLTGNNMFAYCGNNPVMLNDFTGGKAMPFWELLWPGEIHREVQEYLRDNYGYVIEVYVKGKRIDLVKDNNAYEIKPFTVSRELALIQLYDYIMLSDGKYVIGESSPELTGSFVSKRGFTVKFYYKGNGIIQYSFCKEASPIETTVPEQEKNNSSVGNAIIAGVAVAGVTAAVYFAGCGGRISPCREMRSPLLFGGY